MNTMATVSEKPDKQIKNYREDVRELWFGILFSFIFTGVIWLTGGYLRDLESTFLPDQGVDWYYWKMPEPTLLGGILAWGFFLVHLGIIWYLIYYAQTKQRKYSTNLQKFNIIALITNAVFSFLHLFRTHTTYDGLAMSYAPQISQAAVVIMLVMILIMENRRRGMFFGKPAPTITSEVVRAMRKYHGYFFALFIIQAFHFNPMTSATAGHMMGFLYTFLLMLQGSLFYNNIHRDKYWTTFMEAAVLIHGSIVAINQDGISGFWPMFFFGFAGIFVVTQMHGLGLSVKSRWIIMGVYSSLVMVVGFSFRGLEVLRDLIAIPIIDYSLIFVISWFTWLIMRVISR